jgi:hypothetical protein
MSIDTFFTAVFHGFMPIALESVDFTTEELSNIMALLDLQTAVPANGYYFTDITILWNIIQGAHFILGYFTVNGMSVYAIEIGNSIYTVEPRIFHDLIYMLV